MTLQSRWRVGPLCAALLISSGCGKDETDSARFNESIGGRGPITVSGIDRGLLQDLSAYKPATAGGGALGSGGDSGTPAPAGGEAEIAEKAVTNVVDSFVSLSAAGLLDSFDPTEVKALIDGGFTESLQGVFDAFDIVSKTIKKKMSEAETASMAELPAQIMKVAGDAIEVTIVDAEHATATIDPAKIQAWAMDMASKAAAANAASGAGTPPETPGRVEQPAGSPPNAPDAGAPGDNPLAAILAGGNSAAPPPPATFPLNKVDGKWRIVAGRVLSSEVADLLKEGCEITREALNQFSSRIEPVPANDQQAMQNAVMSMMPLLMSQYSGWFQRLQAALAEGAVGSSAEKKPAEDEKKEGPPPETPGIINP